MTVGPGFMMLVSGIVTFANVISARLRVALVAASRVRGIPLSLLFPRLTHILQSWPDEDFRTGVDHVVSTVHRIW